MQIIVRQIALAGSIVLTGLSSAFAAVVDFPNADSSGDLSSAAAWGGTLPGSSDAIEFDKSYGANLTFSSSATFGNLIFAKSSRLTNTVEILDPSVTVSLTGSGDSYPGIRAGIVDYAQLTLKGGTYDLNSVGRLGPNRYQSTAELGCRIILDGATVRKAKSVCAMNAGNKSGLFLRNGAEVFAEDGSEFLHSANAAKQNNSAEVSGGSRLDFSGSFSPFRNYVGDSTFLVSGEGSVVTCRQSAATYSFLFYNNSVRNKLRVEDGAEFNLKGYVLLGGSNATDNEIIVNGGTFRILNGSKSAQLDFPDYGTAWRNTICVQDGGVFSVGGTFNYGGTEEKIIVSNGTFTAGADLVIKGTRSEVRILGPNAKCAVSYRPFVNAKNSILEFGDGYVGSYGYPYFAEGTACSNTISVTRGARMTFGEYNGCSYSGTSIFGYVTRIAEGGKIVTSSDNANQGNYGWSGWDNWTVVSNGTLEVGNRLKLGTVSSTNPSESSLTDTRNTLVFQGKRPCVKVSDVSILDRGSIIRFEVPKGGYENGTVLWETAQLYRNVGEQMRLEITGLDDEFVKTLDAKFDVTLIRESMANPPNPLTSSLQSQVEALQSTMPPRVRLYISADGRELHLAAKPYQGMLLLVR